MADNAASNQEDELSLPRAAVNKMIKEMIPSIRVSNDARELVLNCCTEFIHLLASEANDICNQQTKKTISPEHVIAALQSLGFQDYVEDVESVYQQFKTQNQTRKKNIKMKNQGFTEEELLRQQQALFQQAREQQMEEWNLQQQNLLSQQANLQQPHQFNMQQETQETQHMQAPHLALPHAQPPPPQQNHQAQVGPLSAFHSQPAVNNSVTPNSIVQNSKKEISQLSNIHPSTQSHLLNNMTNTDSQNTNTVKSQIPADSKSTNNQVSKNINTESMQLTETLNSDNTITEKT